MCTSFPDPGGTDPQRHFTEGLSLWCFLLDLSSGGANGKGETSYLEKWRPPPIWFSSKWQCRWVIPFLSAPSVWLLPLDALESESRSFAAVWSQKVRQVWSHAPSSFLCRSRAQAVRKEPLSRIFIFFFFFLTWLLAWDWAVKLDFMAWPWMFLCSGFSLGSAKLQKCLAWGWPCSCNRRQWSTQEY